MVAKREQLAADAQGFVSTLTQGLQSFLQNSSYAGEPCTIALTDRAAHLPGLESRLRAAGFTRLLRLPRGAAACGAACLGAKRMSVPSDLAEVSVETSVPLAETRQQVAQKWDARLQKNKEPGVHVAPTHAILDGIGHAIGRGSRFTIGLSERGADVALPASFAATDDCAVPLIHDAGGLWFVDPPSGRATNGHNAPPARTIIQAGDRLTVRCGNAAAEILFAHCPTTNGTRMD
jgi:hypothetical protein